MRSDRTAICCDKAFVVLLSSWETTSTGPYMKRRAFPEVSSHPAVRSWPGLEIKTTLPDFSCGPYMEWRIAAIARFPFKLFGIYFMRSITKLIKIPQCKNQKRHILATCFVFFPCHCEELCLTLCSFTLIASTLANDRVPFNFILLENETLFSVTTSPHLKVYAFKMPKIKTRTF